MKQIISNFSDKSHNGKRKRIAVSVTAGVMLFLLYSLIFSFSGQDGEESGSLSQFISEKCVELVNALSGRHWTDIMMAEFAGYFEHPLRKLAHFSEYACMGVLIYGIWSPWRRPTAGWGVITVAWIFVSASLDELHQYFVPGRYSSFADVCLDTLGGATGMLVCLFIRRLWQRRGRKKSSTRKKTPNKK